MTRPRPLKVMVPVSVRDDGERRALGNRISFAFIDLPLHLRSARARLESVVEATAEFKRSRRAAGTEVVMGALSALPELLKDQAARLVAGPRNTTSPCPTSRDHPIRSTCWAPASPRRIRSSHSPTTTRSRSGSWATPEICTSASTPIPSFPASPGCPRLSRRRSCPWRELPDDVCARLACTVR